MKYLSYQLLQLLKYLFKISGDTKVHPQEVKMHQGSPSLNKHGERMHGEYNNSETYLLFIKVTHRILKAMIATVA